MALKNEEVTGVIIGAAYDVHRYLGFGFLGKVCRCQVDSDSSCGKFKTRILQGGTHAILGFLHLSFRKANDREGKKHGFAQERD